MSPSAPRARGFDARRRRGGSRSRRRASSGTSASGPRKTCVVSLRQHDGVGEIPHAARYHRRSMTPFARSPEPSPIAAALAYLARSPTGNRRSPRTRAGRFDLGRITRLLAHLGDPHRGRPRSTSPARRARARSSISRMRSFDAHGLRTFRFVSPHVETAERAHRDRRRRPLRRQLAALVESSAPRWTRSSAPRRRTRRRSSCAYRQPGALLRSRLLALSRRSPTQQSSSSTRRSSPGSTPGSPRRSTPGFVELDGPRLRFTHPLLGSAAAARQTPARTPGRSTHGSPRSSRLPRNERATLALATAEAGPKRRRELGGGRSNGARPRGAGCRRRSRRAGAFGSLPALGLGRRPPPPLPRSRPPPRRRRPRASQRAARRRAMRSCRPGDPACNRAGARLARAQVSPQRAIPLYHEALLEAQGDNALQATIHFGLAMWMRLGGDGFRRALEHAELAVSLASDIVDAGAPRCQVLGEYGRTHFAAGRGIAWETMEGALSAERSLDGWPLHDGPTFRFGEQLLCRAPRQSARSVSGRPRRRACAERPRRGVGRALGTRLRRVARGKLGEG